MIIEKRIISTVLISIILVLFAGCKEYDNPIPDKKVYFRTSYEDYTKLSAPGSWKCYYDDGRLYAANTYLGFAGICIFRDLEGNIRACDLGCPIECDKNVRVSVKMPYATCNSCGSKFDLSFGICGPIEGDSKYALRIYSHVSDRGSYILVTN